MEADCAKIASRAKRDDAVTEAPAATTAAAPDGTTAAASGTSPSVSGGKTPEKSNPLKKMISIPFNFFESFFLK